MSRNPQIEARVTAAFREQFGSAPAGIARAPGRVNLIGEHTDYNEGWVLPAAIERAVYLAAAPRADPVLEISAPDVDERVSLPLPDPAKSAEEQAGAYPPWARYAAGVAWALARRGFRVPGLRGVFSSSVPIGSGLSSSAALEVAFALAFQAAGGWSAPRMDLARACQEAEHSFTGVRCGLMDQFASLHGREGCALLLDCRSMEYEPIPIPPSAVLVIADTRVRHKLGDGAYNERRAQCEQAVNILARSHPQVRALRDVTPGMLRSAGDSLPEVVRRRAEHVVMECERTLLTADALRRGDLAAAGELMDAGHASLRDLYQVSVPELDAMAGAARSIPGCFGARLTGAGFGGCTIQLVEREQADTFVDLLATKYFDATGIPPEVVATRPAEGADWVESS
ncbi:MAG: galactokinase [Anaerolineales bacterium]|nr:galactokinase [Anaerolineales bacterium]